MLEIYYSKMLKENLYAKEHEDNTSRKLRLGLVLGAEYVTDFNAQHTEGKGNNTDKGDCL